MNKKDMKDKPAVRPSKQVCESCKWNAMCLAYAGYLNYRCSEMRQ